MKIIIKQKFDLIISDCFIVITKKPFTTYHYVHNFTTKKKKFYNFEKSWIIVFVSSRFTEKCEVANKARIYTLQNVNMFTDHGLQAMSWTQ